MAAAYHQKARVGWQEAKPEWTQWRSPTPIDSSTDDDDDDEYGNRARQQGQRTRVGHDGPTHKAKPEWTQWRSPIDLKHEAKRTEPDVQSLQRWNDYLAAFRPVPADADLDLLLLWRRDDIPWPTPSGLEKDISETSIRRFIKTYTLKYSEQAGGDWKKAVRQNQVLWHPDKFQQLLARKLERLTEGDRKAVVQRVNEISQILNGLVKE